MKELGFINLFHIFYEMLGAMYWPLVFITLFIIFSFIALLLLEKRIARKRFTAATIIGIMGGIGGLFLLKDYSNSPSLIIIGGAIDAVLVLTVFIVGFISIAIFFYTLIGWRATLSQ